MSRDKVVANNISISSFYRLNPTDEGRVKYQNIFLHFYKPCPQEIEELKREIDEDQSGEIEFHEFLEIMNSKTLRFF